MTIDGEYFLWEQGGEDDKIPIPSDDLFLRDILYTLLTTHRGNVKPIVNIS